MSFQPILMRANVDDFAFLVERLRSPLNPFAANRRLADALAAFRTDRSQATKSDLAELVEREIRYVASSDLACAVRLARNPAGTPAGISLDEVISDVARRLKVRVSSLGSTGANVQHLVRRVVEREFAAMSPVKQREMLVRHVGEVAAEEVLRLLRRQGPVAVLPALLSIVGREALMRVVTALVTGVLAGFVGWEAAKQFLAAMAARFPWAAELVGPVAWTASVAWMAIDLQGPAARKTIPTVLYVGLIALREAPAGTDPWTEPDRDEEPGPGGRT